MRRRDSRIPRTLQIAAAFEGARYGHVAGDIVRFRGDGSPLRSLRIGIDPVQDLHGYDSPWPAGGGKNKLAPAFSAGTTKTASDVNYLFNSDGTVSVSGTCSDANSWQDVVSYFSLPAGTYTLSGGAANGIYLSLRTNNNIALATSRLEPETFTISETTTVRVRACVLANTVVPSNTVLRPQLESGSTATPYAPYSNLCPISGWDSVTAWRTGKNLLPIQTITKSGSQYFIGDGSTYFLFKAGTYTASNVGTAAYMYWRKKGTTDINIIHTGNANSGTFTLTEDCEVRFWFYTYDADASFTNIQIELGSTPTTYAPYTGASYPITIPTEAGTVYGGYISVGADGSAELVVDREEVDLGTLEWSSWGTVEGLYGAEISDMKAPTTAEERKTDILCSMYPVAASATMNNNFTDKSCARYQQNVFVRDTSYATAAALTTALDGVSFVYPLATPLHYPLSDITVQTLAGANVMWADCGPVDVEYVADNGVEGGKLALLLRNRPELLIAMRKGGSSPELLLAMGSRGDARPSIAPIRPGLEIKDEEEEMRKW